jgi:hypothetical protein
MVSVVQLRLLKVPKMEKPPEDDWGQGFAVKLEASVGKRGIAPDIRGERLW